MDDKSLNKKIKLSYAYVHDKFLKKYSAVEYFPIIFHTGTYNCVSASMLYALIFVNLDIPFKVNVSSNHVYLVANPGPNSVVIETTNPGFERMIFNGEFKRQYVEYLKSSKLISENEYKSKSVEEIFEEKFNQVRDAEFNNLPGIQYYNKALSELERNSLEKALILGQKAYFFYPDYQTKMLLHNCLLFHIEKCRFEKVSDIDYLGQLSRFENTDINMIASLFNNIILHHLQYTDKEEFCDSLNQRLISQLNDRVLIEELNFMYNLQMCYRYQNTDKVEKYVTNALSIKGNHNDANFIMENYLRRKINNIGNPSVRLDTISSIRQRFNNENIQSLLTNYKLAANLEIAKEMYNQKRVTEGNNYLNEFEKNFVPPLDNQMLSTQIELTYQAIAVYYFNRGDKIKAKVYLKKGLEYVPNSAILRFESY